MSLLREYIREQILAEENVAKGQLNADLFGEIGEFMETHHYDDVLDSVFKRIAPNLVRHVMEQEINEDVSEFLDGAIEGRFERSSGRFSYEDPSPEDTGHPSDSVDYTLGYTWGWNNADTWKGNELPEKARKEAIELQITEFEDQISEQMVIAALETANEKVNPVKLIKKAIGAIRSAVQEEGWVGGLKKGLPIAIGIIVGEALDNFIIPMAIFSLTGIPFPPLPIGVGEIINPIVISMVGADTETEALADELGWYENEYGETDTLPPRETNELREYIKSLLTEKELRGQKDKRVMYHIGKRPASPKPAERWGEQGGWTRSWMKGPVPSGVFLTPNPVDVVQHHGVSGNVYTYKVPEWVIDKAGGKQRYDSAGELLISQEIWEEAGDEIEFLGKKMGQQELWDSVDPSYFGDRRYSNRKKKPGEVSISSLAQTKHPEQAIKMMTDQEREKAWEQFQEKYPGSLKGEPFEIEWEKVPGERKGQPKSWRIGEPRISKYDKNLIDLLQKHMKESVVREYVRGLLIEQTDWESDETLPPEFRNLPPQMKKQIPLSIRKNFVRGHAVFEPGQEITTTSDWDGVGSDGMPIRVPENSQMVTQERLHDGAYSFTFKNPTPVKVGMKFEEDTIAKPGDEAVIKGYQLWEIVTESVVRNYIRDLLIEQNVMAAGMCFPFAYQKAEEWFEDHFTPGGRGRGVKRHPDLNDKRKFKVVHGTVTDKWKKPPKPVVHGWVEMGDLVFDDQTKHTKPNGVKKEDYYETYQPEIKKEFTAEEAIVNCVKYGGEGPWDEELYAQMQQRDAWKEGR